MDLWRPWADALAAISMVVAMVTASNSWPLSGRYEEKETLKRLLESPRAEFLALYGRRRVGKTFLIRRFFEGQKVDFFEMTGRYQGNRSGHLRIFAEALAEAFHDGAPLATPGGWDEAFRLLRSAIEKRKRRHKVVLFFDELPWIAGHRSGCLPALEHFWNAWSSQRNDILLIVCGSAASWMLRNLVGARGGLHNRLTATIRLLPFTLAEVQTYARDRRLGLTQRDLVELYLSLGGVPHYLDHLQRGRSVTQHIDALCLHKDGALRSEFTQLYASLFRDDKNYLRVVRALAGRRGGLPRGDLLQAAGMRTGGGATTVLDNLKEGGFIGESIPPGRTSRDRIYRLTDEFSRFHLQWLAHRPPQSWQHVRGTPRWQVWAGLAFESLCQKHVPALQRQLGISGVAAEVASWAHPEAQVDLLIDRADGIISVCEMKFTEGPFTITKVYADRLRRKLQVFRDVTGTRKALQLVFVTSYGVTENRYARELVDQTVLMDALFLA